MRTLLNFALNLLLFMLAMLCNIWVESLAYWYAPDAIFSLAVWLLFVQRRINYLALVLASMFADISLANQFGSHLVAMAFTLYCLGISGFGNRAKNPLIGSLGLFCAYLLHLQIIVFINYGPPGLLDQHFLFSLSKAGVTALTWLVVMLLVRATKRHDFLQF